MKNVMLLVTLCSLPILAHARNKVDASLETRIEAACERQLGAASPATLKALNVPIRSFCYCIAGEHAIQATEYQLQADAEPYLKTILSFYSTSTAKASEPIRAKNVEESQLDIDFADKCNKK